MVTRHLLSLFILIVLMPALSAGVRAESPLFPADPAMAEPLTVELHMPMTEHRRARRDETVKIDATLRTQDGQEFAITVTQRGKSRLERCEYYPLWLNFKKKSTADTVFEGQNKLKLVTHCSEKYATSGFVAGELLAYRLLNMLTDVSFRVRALNLTYVDTERNWSKQRPAFLIEHKNSVMKRLQAQEAEIASVAPARLEPEYTALIGLFQMLIGNTDYSLRQGPSGELCCHNAVAMERDGLIWSVPYDFDVTGLVNPPYARPPPALGIRRVTSRLYRGYCAHASQVQEAGELIAEKRAAIFELVASFDDLPNLRSGRIETFLNGYFKIWDDPGRRASRIDERCLGERPAQAG